MKIRLANKSDSKFFATIHIKAFDDFFLSSLGVRFLNCYYKASLVNKQSIAFCAIDENGEIIGFTSGCVNSLGYHKRLLKDNFFSFLFQGIILIFTNPMAIFRLAKNMEKIKSDDDDGNYAELLSIGVLPSHMGLGYGKALIKVFEEEAIKRGCRKISLTTDYIGNHNVLYFYKSLGYNLFYEFTTFPNRKMLKLIKNIPIK